MRPTVIISLILVISAVLAQDIAISTAAGQQIVPAVASDGTDFFITWEDARAGTGNPNIYGRIVNADGSLPGLESPVCAFAGLQKIPDVAWGGGYYLDVWFDRRTAYQIYGNLVSPDGTLSGDNFNIATVDGTIQSVRVSGMPGAFLVVWEVRIFGVSDMFFVITKPDMTTTVPRQMGFVDGDEKNPALARGASEWVVILEDSLAAGKGLYAQKISYIAGSVDTSGLYLVSSVTREESFPAIAYGGGGYLVAYERAGTSGRDIYGILLNSAGTPVGLPFPISTAEGNQVRPSVSFDGVGYLVVWQDNRDVLSDIIGQRVGASGTLIGPELAVSIAAGTQQKPRSVATNEHHMVVWEDARDVTSDIYATMLPALTISGAPDVTVIQPSSGIVTSCNRYPVKILVEDSDGVDPFSVRFFNGTDTITGYSSSIVFIGDTLRYTPSADWPSGVPINLSLVDVADIFGNHIETPVNWSFTADLVPPVIDNLIPRRGQILTEFPASISANLTDAITGINISTLIVVYNGDTLRYPDSHLSWDGWTVRITPDTASSTVGTHSVRIRVGDTPGVCDPNYAVESWDFFVNPSGGPNASAVRPRAGDVVASASPEIVLKIVDPDGIDVSSIQVSVGGVVYSWPSAALSFSDSMLTINPAESYVHEQVVIVNLIRARDLIGSDLDAPLAFSFVVDLRPPVSGGFFPRAGDTLHIGTDDVWIIATDEPAGMFVSPERVSYEFFDLSLTLIERAVTGLTARGDTVVLQSGAFGASFGDGSEVIICANLADNPDHYGPNDTSYCWQVFVQLMAISEADLPDEMQISIMPNPFNASCLIKFAGDVEILDISGKIVNEIKDCGRGKIWEGGDFDNNPVPSGIYFVRSADGKAISRAVLLR